ncbi:MAG: AmmeMemoRadiSam system radical SAM enzyme [Actinobacteria bacterium]|nr:AmmeMemoRadiSam system radical SAM enzyme [Actinomycetota bacterium]
MEELSGLPEAQFYEKLEEGRVRCNLCPQLCLIRPGKVGFCFIRGNREGVLYPLLFGRVSSAYLDPIEKKPLYHFHPRSTIFSIGGIGCNLRCPWCQNWNIAQPRDAFPKLQAEQVISQFTQELPPARAVELALEYRDGGCIGIAYTYNEPLVWLEYVESVGRLAKEAGLKNVLVTNGYVEEEPLRKILSLIDAMNMDVKGFSNEFYRRVAGRLEPVLRTAEISKAAGCHIEITNLVIPTLNDSDEDFHSLADWIADRLGRDTPLHFSRYFPSYKLDVEPTPIATLKRAEKIARARLDHVHLGNI